MYIFPTMITPYKKDGTIDYDTAVKYVDWYFEAGLNGIFSVCQSSEIFFLSLEEKAELNRVVYQRAKELEKTHGKESVVVSSGNRNGLSIAYFSHCAKSTSTPSPVFAEIGIIASNFATWE